LTALMKAKSVYREDVAARVLPRVAKSDAQLDAEAA